MPSYDEMRADIYLEDAWALDDARVVVEAYWAHIAPLHKDLENTVQCMAESINAGEPEAVRSHMRDYKTIMGKIAAWYEED